MTVLARCLRIAVALTAAVHSFSAWAQVESGSSEMAACLMPRGEERNRLTYPPDALAAGVSGTTTVEMEFSAPDAPPRVRVTQSADPRLDRAVLEHVGTYRMPCLKPGATIRATQQFAFVPNPGGKVSWTDPSDPQALKLMACVQHLRPGTKPEHPFGAGPQMMRGIRDVPIRGNVLARIVFTSKDGEPEVTFPGSNAAPAFQKSVEQWARDYRLPCYDGNRVEAVQMFRFVASESDGLLKDMQLVQFLGTIKGLDRQRRYFELDRMSCPFNVRFEYRQPAMPNSVRDVGAHVASRKPLLDWFASMQFDVDQRSENLLLGESMTISVPCGKIDL
jgi:hypothetical protein